MGLWISHFLNQIFVADLSHEAHPSHQTPSHLHKGFIQLQALGLLGRGWREEKGHRLGMSERILPPCLTVLWGPESHLQQTPAESLILPSTNPSLPLPAFRVFVSPDFFDE